MLKALLEEVRELRRTIERNNLRQLQAQILLKGIEKQQGHVANMSLELDQLRAHIQDLSNIGRHDETLKEAENAIREAVDPQSRALLTQAYEDLRKSLERQKKLDQQELENRRERDRQLEAQLRTEQAKLAELQEQLAALERELDKQANLGART
jgi:activator of HSP90 ATPase